MGDKREMTQEQIKAKAKEYFPNDEFKQQIVIDAINWATKELQKENAELKRHIKADCIDCADYYKNKRLEKENAELKDYRLTTLAKQQTEMSKYALNLEHKLGWYDTQLTKAKDLLAKWVELFKPKGGNIPPTPIQEQTEQFLNSEVEK